MRVRVVALGNPAAGDDGFGPAVLQQLVGTLPADVELLRARDIAMLAGCVVGVSRLIVVDAAIGLGPPGTLRVMSPADLSRDDLALGLSSHDLDVDRALALGTALAGDDLAADVLIVAAAAGSDRTHALRLSPAVRAAVEPAAMLVRQLVGDSAPDEGA